MAIFAKIEHPDPDWWMVDPIEVELGHKATFASGIEVIIEARNTSGAVIPETRIKILGYRDKQGGKIDGQEMNAHRIEEKQLGVVAVKFYPEMPDEGFGNDQQQLEDYDFERRFEVGEKYIEKLKLYQRERRKLAGAEDNGVAKEIIGDIVERAGIEILNALDSGLLELRAKRVDDSR